VTDRRHRAFHIPAGPILMEPTREVMAMPMVLIAVPLEPHGSAVLAETDEESWEGESPFGRVADPVKALTEAPDSVREALDKVVVPTARLFMERLRNLSPDAVDFEFGLKFSGKAGLVFTSATAEAHIKVTLKWAPATAQR
jgi:hypothetical protein